MGAAMSAPIEAARSMLPGDLVLNAEDIFELGLEEAPVDAGPSIEEIVRSGNGGHDHG